MDCKSGDMLFSRRFLFRFHFRIIVWICIWLKVKRQILFDHLFRHLFHCSTRIPAYPKIPAPVLLQGRLHLELELQFKIASLIFFINKYFVKNSKILLIIPLAFRNTNKPEIIKIFNLILELHSSYY